MKQFTMLIYSGLLILGSFAPPIYAATCSVADFGFQCDVSYGSSCGSFLHSSCDGKSRVPGKI